MEIIRMKIELLGNCIETLKELHARTRETVEVSIVEELETVIDQLEQLREVADEGEVKVDAKLVMRVLDSIAHTVKVTSNLSEIIRYFLNAQ